MQNRIRLAQEQKIPYMLVLGDREIADRTVAVRRRDGTQEPPVGWSELAERLRREVAERVVEAPAGEHRGA
jgi:threonyl-tRNA synthetase